MSATGDTPSTNTSSGRPYGAHAAPEPELPHRVPGATRSWVGEDGRALPVKPESEESRPPERILARIRRALDFL